MKIALFVPCFVDQLFPRVAIAGLEVLERLGLEVAVPEGAVCCGQPAANAGFERESEPALRAFADVFESWERIVVLSGSCAAHLRSHARADVAERTMEFCAFLHDEVGAEAVASLGAVFPQRVALHLGCHALRGLGLARPSEIQAAPFNKVQALLQTVNGLSFAELDRPDECCGFGGTFAVKNADTSMAMLSDKLRHVLDTRAEVCTAADTSCLMHIGGALRRQRAGTRVMHLAEILAAQE